MKLSCSPWGSSNKDMIVDFVFFKLDSISKFQKMKVGHISKFGTWSFVFHLLWKAMVGGKKEVIGLLGEG